MTDTLRERTTYITREPVAGINNGDEEVLEQRRQYKEKITVEPVSRRQPIITRRFLLSAALASLVILFFYYALFKGGQKAVEITERAAEKVKEGMKLCVFAILFFSGVTKLGDKVIEKGKDVAENLVDKTKEGFQYAKRKLGNAGEKIQEKAHEGF